MDYYDGCPQFGGCPASDEVARVYSPDKFYIVNPAPRGEGGSHWVLLFQDMYFDSFGVPPPLAIKPYVERWNNTHFQDFHSAACGFYCIYVADNLLAGRAPEGDLAPDDEAPFADSHNERILRKYFDHRVGKGFFPLAGTS